MNPRNATPDGAVSLYLRQAFQAPTQLSARLTDHHRPKNNRRTQNTPEKIRCFIGGEWKPRSEFSGRQLDKFARSHAQPGSSQISCRIHSTQIRRELKCEGPCAKWLPIENFSRSTRTHSKTWCMDCTEWQLSVEPGYAPYVPPSSFDEEEEEESEDADECNGNEIAPPDDVACGRIEDWIQTNPSELGDYDTYEAGTQHSVMGSVSDMSGPSLLDTRNRELGRLPEALTAISLGIAGSSGPVRPSYASMASTARAPLSNVSQASRTAPRTSYANAASVSQSNQSISNTLFSADSMGNATNQSQSVSGASTIWMENEFSALTTGRPQPPPVEMRNGWARPAQRKTDLTAPRYVANNGDMDVRPQNIQRPVYADTDDEGSEDEC